MVQKNSSRLKLSSEKLSCLAVEVAAATDANTRFIITGRTKEYRILLKDRQSVMQ